MILDRQIAYARNGTLFVVSFDAKRLEVKGTPVPVIEGVQTGASNGDGVFDVSNNGTLVFQPGTFGAIPRNLVWMDRTGKATNITPEVKPYAMVSMSRDGKRVPLVLQTSTFDVWVYDVERDTFTRASFGGDDYRPFFSPDGTLLAYDSSKSGSQQVFVKHGIQKIQPAPGEPFDPHRHQALFEVEGRDYPAGTVAEILLPGYAYHERLLRPALVGVAKSRAAQAPGRSE